MLIRVDVPIEACRATMRGEPFLYPAAVRALVRDYLDRASRGEATPEDPLSPRELEVLKLIAEGLTSEEIASQNSSSARRRLIATARTSSKNWACATALS